MTDLMKIKEIRRNVLIVINWWKLSKRSVFAETFACRDKCFLQRKKGPLTLQVLQSALRGQKILSSFCDLLQDKRVRDTDNFPILEYSQFLFNKFSSVSIFY